MELVFFFQNYVVKYEYFYPIIRGEGPLGEIPVG